MADDDLQQMKRGTMDASGRDLTSAGRVCAMVATCLFVLQVLLLCLFLIAALLGR